MKKSYICIRSRSSLGFTQIETKGKPKRSSKNSTRVIRSSNSVSIISRRNNHQKSASDVPVTTQLTSFPLEYIPSLYQARCIDLDLPVNSNQEKRFHQFCETIFDRKVVQLTKFGMGPNSAEILGKIVSRKSDISSLILADNALGDIGLLTLIRYLKQSHSLVHINLRNNDLSSHSLSTLFELLGKHLSIVSVDISSNDSYHRNKLGVKGALNLPVMLKNPLITFLNLFGTSLTSDSLEYIAEGLKGNSSLLYLNIGYNDICPKNLSSLVNVLSSTHVQDLNLEQNRLGDEGVRILSTQLIAEKDPKCKINKLNLSKNKIGTTGASHLLSALQRNEVLKELSLEGNSVGKEIGPHIASFLCSNSQLQVLNLRSCKLQFEGVWGVARGLIKNKGLLHLNLSRNSVGNKGIDALSQCLKLNRNLLSIDLSSNKIGNSGGIIFVHILKLHRSIEKVNLQHNSLNEEFSQYVVDTLLYNNNLSQILLEANSLSIKSLLRIREITSRNRTSSGEKVIPDIITEIDKIMLDENNLKKVQRLINSKKKEEFTAKQRLVKDVGRFEMHQEKETKKYQWVIEKLGEVKETEEFLSQQLTSLLSEIHFVRASYRNIITERDGDIKRLNDSLESSRKYSRF